MQRKSAVRRHNYPRRQCRRENVEEYPTIERNRDRGAHGLQQLSVEKAGDIARFIAGNDHSLVAISLGATFFGALTYIDNEPNLLVKAITEHARVPTPTFFGHVFKFALPVLIPIFLLVSILFFR